VLCHADADRGKHRATSLVSNTTPEKASTMVIGHAGRYCRRLGNQLQGFEEAAPV
jgi:hypothetical protein